MKHDDECWVNESMRELGVGGEGLASCTCGLSAMKAAIEAARHYLKTGTPFARAALERALEELNEIRRIPR